MRIFIFFVSLLFCACGLSPTKEPYADCRMNHSLDFCNWQDAPYNNAFGSQNRAGYEKR